jgi:hypothetical protein
MYGPGDLSELVATGQLGLLTAENQTETLLARLRLFSNARSDSPGTKAAKEVAAGRKHDAHQYKWRLADAEGLEYRRLNGLKGWTFECRDRTVAPWAPQGPFDQPPANSVITDDERREHLHQREVDRASSHFLACCRAAATYHTPGEMRVAQLKKEGSNAVDQLRGNLAHQSRCPRCFSTSHTSLLQCLVADLTAPSVERPRFEGDHPPGSRCLRCHMHGHRATECLSCVGCFRWGHTERSCGAAFGTLREQWYL